MNTTRILTSAVVAAVLTCAAPAYSQVLGGNAAGGLGGTLGGGLGGITGAGHGDIGGSLDSDVVGRVGHTTDRIGSRVKRGAVHGVGKARDVTAAGKAKTSSAAQSAASKTSDIAASAEASASGAINATRSAAAGAQSDAATSTAAGPRGNGLDMSGALGGATEVTRQPAAIAPASAGTPEQTSSSNDEAAMPGKSPGLDVSGTFDGNAAASAKRDESQPAGRKVDASASADAKASASRH